MAINEGEHVGVIGPNGAGKTTFFKILIQEEDLDSGTITRSQNLSLGYLSQHDQWQPDETGNSFIERFAKIPIWEIKSLGRELQLSEDLLNRPILSLSGGYRMRIKLMALLGSNPNLLLLDEPTNYLDLETTLLLERFLQNFRGAFLLISHDREFLRRTTDHTVEVEGGEITKYHGNIDDYFEQKELLRSQLAAQAQNQAEKRKSILEFVERFGAKASKAKQAQSRLRTLEKMEVIEFKAVPISSVIQIPEPAHVGKSILRLENVGLGYPGKTILNQVNLEIQRGDHVAVVGLNGAGKSTLLKGLAGTLKPLAGTRHLGYQVELAIFNQHVIEVLDPNATVLESLQSAAATSVSTQDIRNMAGSLLFSGEQIHKKTSVLSGGEKSRVALGQILLRRVPCLLLDEPTNHLDFQTVEALTQSLKAYTGTLIVVSHDRGFIERVATKILEVSSGEVHVYPGAYNEYVWSLQLALKNQEPADIPLSRKKAPTTPSTREEKKDRDRQIRNLEKKIQQYESEIAKLEALNHEYNEKMMADPTSALELASKMADNSAKLLSVERDWVQAGADLSELTQVKNN